jgi:hypothetical protein
MQDVVGEFDELVLPDKRLAERVRGFVTAAWRSPGQSFPKMLEDASQLEGAYRLLNNPRVTFTALQAAHSERTAKRARSQTEVLVIHDTTHVEAAYADPLEVGFLPTGRPGYQAHVSLAVAVEAGRVPRPLGVLSAIAYSQRRAPTKKRKNRRNQQSGWATARSKDKAFLRWERGIESSADALQGCESVIHVADREADSYALFCKVMVLGHGCVFRIRCDRRARLDDDEVEQDWSSLSEIAANMQGSFELPVPLSKRGDKGAPRQLRTHPPRAERQAVLQYSATRVELRKPHYAPAATLPETITLTLVRAWEPHPPAGEKSIEWMLLTSEPCETSAEIKHVVELYRARWIIEDFFKALKTGCSLEDRQLESRHALLNALALFLPIAVHLLWLRTCARDLPDAPATEAFTPLQLEVLGHRSHRKLPPNPTVLQAMWALAGIGGHIANNGWPGWQVLGRAFVTLLEAVETWKIAVRATRAKM